MTITLTPAEKLSLLVWLSVLEGDRETENVKVERAERKVLDLIKSKVAEQI